MYCAVRERARSSSQIVGLSSSILVTAIAGCALSSIGVNIVSVIEKPISFTPLAEDKSDEPLAPPDIPLPPIFPVEAPLAPIPNAPIWIVDIDPEVPVTPAPTPRKPEPAATPTPKPTRIRPALLSTNPPPYPASEIRQQNEGVTTLEVCVDANGRTSSATVKASSGHSVLDNAALKWIRSARFKPGTLDGAAQSVCGHEVVYEWRLENTR